MFHVSSARWRLSGLLLLPLVTCRSTPPVTDAPLLDKAAPKPDRPADSSRPSSEAAADQSRPFRCVENWPVFAAAQPKPSLQVKAPAELWRKSLPNANFIPETAFSGTHLGIVTGNRIWILDRQGNITGHLQDVQSQSAGSGPVADHQGNFYFVTKRAVKVLPNGTVEWFFDLGPNISPSLETTQSSNLLLSPDGTLYFSASDGYLYALSIAGNQRQKWKVQVGLGKSRYARALGGGVSDVILMEGLNHSTADGAAIDDPLLDGKPVEVGWALPEGLVGSWQVGDNSALFDRCGKLIWAFPKTGDSWWIRLLDLDRRYLVVASTYPKYSYYYYSGGGTQLLGPKDVAGGAEALGADGTIYALNCVRPPGSSGDLTLIAYSPALEPLWSLPLGEYCLLTSVVLADDGVLYLTRSKGLETEVIAIQTRSPGLAGTAYPIRGYNNRRTGWLAPE